MLAIIDAIERGGLGYTRGGTLDRKRAINMLARFSAGVPLLFLTTVSAADDVLLPGDAAAGKKLYDSKCAACHVSLVGGDGSALHTRPNRRVKTAEGLLGQVEGCNQQLKAGLSPGQIKDVVAYLYKAFYQKPR